MTLYAYPMDRSVALCYRRTPRLKTMFAKMNGRWIEANPDSGREALSFTTDQALQDFFTTTHITRPGESLP